MEPELGNFIFGNSRGPCRFPDRDLVDSEEWEAVIEYARCSFYGYTEDKDHENESGGFSNDVFDIHPYYWGDCTCDAGDWEEHKEGCPCLRHNFIFKPTGFWIDWYKYPFRDSYMPENKTAEQVKEIFKLAVAKSKEVDHA